MELAPLARSLAVRARDLSAAELRRRGRSATSIAEAQRDTIAWTRARARVLATRRGLLEGQGIRWSASGYAELVPVEALRAGRGDVAVLTEISAVSPGTERAQYLRLPNTDARTGGSPGYSGTGRIIEIGRDVTGLRPGDAVAVIGAPHDSVVTVPAERVVRVPEGVAPQQAALVTLGVICRHGVGVAELTPADRLAVIGAGPIGQMAQRLGAAIATPVAMIARSRRHEAAAFAGGVEQMLVADDKESVRSVQATVVIEATGDPEGIHVALAAVADGGRIVLLGSPRGATHDFPAHLLQQRGLTVVGAHIATLGVESRLAAAEAQRHEGERFLAALARRELEVGDLAGEPHDPREAPLFYRRLATDRGILGGHFDWSRLAEEDRRSGQWLRRLPDIGGRGMDPDRPLRSVRRAANAAGSPLRLADPFAAAAGMLRIGMVGCGEIAVHNAAGIHAAPNAELTAAFDPSPSLAEDLVAGSSARVAASYDEILQLDAVDAVFICTPHHLHAPLAVQAARAGKHVIVEKPMASDLAGALEMRRAAAAAGVHLSVCFPQRYDPVATIAKQLVDAGAIGPLLGTAVRMYLDKTPAYWIGGYTGRTQSDWRRTRAKAGGGILIMNMSHHLDLVRHITGAEVEDVAAQAAAVEDDAEVEDALVVSLRFAGGAIGSVVASSVTRGTNEGEVSLWGTAGRLYTEPAPRVYTHRALAGLRTARWQGFGDVPTWTSRAVFVSRLASALHAGRTPEVSADDGVAVQSIIEAAYRASSERCSIRPSDLTEAR